MINLNKTVQDNIESIINIREEIHNNAELSFKEFKTAEIIKGFLKNLDIDTKSLIETGVVGVLNQGDECIAIRADIDALPVNGVSHACGHDYHAAVALGCAQVLKKIGFKKCVKFIFQPGEEDTGGAAPMIRDGVLDSPKVKYIIGFHVWPRLEVGKIEVTSGASMASVDDFSITFKGRGGHAAMPHICKNPIYPAMDFIQSMNNKVHLEINPLNSFVLTFSSINAGNAPNVISDNARVLGTVRTFDNQLRKTIKNYIEELADLSAKKFNCEVTANIQEEYPPLFSDELLTNRFIKAAKDILGQENVCSLEKSFAGEDFSFFAEAVPSVHFRLGISDGLKGENPLHSTNFDASDKALYYGIYTVVNFILSMENDI